MMEVRLIIMALICLFIAQVAFATEDNYQFASADKQQRFINLTKELRCTACQNQTLFDSTAAVAVDIRTQIYTMLLNNESDVKIRSYLSDRYGAFILFNTPLQPKTLALWFGPLVMLALAVIFYLKNIYAKRAY